MRKLSLKGKLIFLIACMIVYVTIFFVVIGYRNHGVASKYQEVIEKYDKICNDILEINAYSSRAGVKVASLVENTSATEADIKQKTTDFQEIEADIAAFAGELEKLLTDGTLKQKYETIQANMDTEKKYVDQIIGYAGAQNYTEAKNVYENSFEPIAIENDTLLDEISSESQKKASEQLESVEKANVTTQMLTGIFLAFFILSGLIIGSVVIVDIRRPLQSVVDGVQRLARGDVHVRVEKHNNDEIGQVADAVNLLAEKNKHAADVAETMSGGDFSIDIVPETEEDVLGNSLKRLVDGNNATLSEIREAAGKVGSESQQVAMASQSLAQGSTEQASAVEQVTASIADITERTKVNAENAKEASSLVEKAKVSALEGNEEMEHMVEAMREINESSENISKIIKTIDDIAFQTNILALNAAVEAARAGEHGKGFAVVSEEVRSLAAKSAEAASETAELIEDSIAKVQYGSEHAGKTAKKLDEMVQAVDDIVSLIQNIATASNDQANALSQVSLAVEQVSQVVQTNSATSEECAAASEELSNQSANLKVLVDQYKLRGMRGGAARRIPTSFAQNSPAGMGQSSGQTSNQDSGSAGTASGGAAGQTPGASAGNSAYSSRTASSSSSGTASYQRSTGSSPAPRSSASAGRASSYSSGVPQISSGGSSYGSGSAHTIPDASDFMSETDAAANEQIISLEDDIYSKY